MLQKEDTHTQRTVLYPNNPLPFSTPLPRQPPACGALRLIRSAFIYNLRLLQLPKTLGKSLVGITGTASNKCGSAFRIALFQVPPLNIVALKRKEKTRFILKQKTSSLFA